MFIDTRGLVHNDGAGYNPQNGQVLNLGDTHSPNVRFDPGLLRPFIDKNGNRCVSLRTGRLVKNAKGIEVPEAKKFNVGHLISKGIWSPTFNATSLSKDQWIQLDSVVQRAARQRLRAWADLSGSSSVGGFDAMSKMTIEYEAMSDPGEALVDMDGLADGRTDSPLRQLRSTPLPITHSDFWFSARRLAISRNGGEPLDTTMAEAAGRRVAEMIEKTLIGVETGIAYGTRTTEHTGTSKVYGYTNFPYRITKTDLTTPTGSNPEAVKQDIIEMRELLATQGFYGPFILYHTPGYDAYLDDDYFRSGSTAIQRTTRERIMAIEGIADIRRLDFWTGSTYQLIMVQMTPDVVRAINGMDITTVQWESKGGMKLNFKIMAIQVPEFRFNYDGDTGIVHATTS